MRLFNQNKKPQSFDELKIQIVLILRHHHKDYMSTSQEQQLLNCANLNSLRRTLDLLNSTYKEKFTKKVSDEGYDTDSTWLAYHEEYTAEEVENIYQNHIRKFSPLLKRCDKLISQIEAQANALSDTEHSTRKKLQTEEAEQLKQLFDFFSNAKMMLIPDHEKMAILKPALENIFNPFKNKYIHLMELNTIVLKKLPFLERESIVRKQVNLFCTLNEKMNCARNTADLVEAINEAKKENSILAANYYGVSNLLGDCLVSAGKLVMKYHRVDSTEVSENCQPQPLGSINF